MMIRFKSMELMVGLFMILGMLALILLAFKVSGLTSYMSKGGYYVHATFDNIGGLKARAPVTIAGVKIGKVSAINLNAGTYQADVTIYVDNHFKDIPIDSSAQILTEGLLGSNYISVIPGFKNTYLTNGGKISDTHSALILENLLGQLLFKVTGADSKDKDKT